MYRITQVIVKPKKEKELCSYFKDMCENYTYLKNDANFHIRQHMTGLKKSEGERYENESESIKLFQEYIPKMCENSQAYHDKRVQNIMDNEKLSDSEKQDKIKSVKPPVVYEIPDEEQWFLDAYIFIYAKLIFIHFLYPIFLQNEKYRKKWLIPIAS